MSILEWKCVRWKGEQPWRGSIQNAEITMEVDIQSVITVHSLGISKRKIKTKKANIPKINKKAYK